MLRSLTHAGAGLADLVPSLPDTEIASLRVCPESEVIGKSLGELDFRSAYGATVLAINRDSAMIPNPPAEEKFQQGDLALILGAPAQIVHVAARFRSAAHTCETE
jgi:CPA2 family monovalent cation:H+ antiporter-2